MLWCSCSEEMRRSLCSCSRRSGLTSTRVTLVVRLPCQDLEASNLFWDDRMEPFLLCGWSHPLFLKIYLRMTQTTLVEKLWLRAPGTSIGLAVARGNWVNPKVRSKYTTNTVPSHWSLSSSMKNVPLHQLHMYCTYYFCAIATSQVCWNLEMKADWTRPCFKKRETQLPQDMDPSHCIRYDLLLATPCKPCLQGPSPPSGPNPHSMAAVLWWWPWGFRAQFL